MDHIEDPEKLRILKQKKFNEGHLEVQNESIISTDKTSDISALVKNNHRPAPKPVVKMSDIFNKIEALKKEVIENIEDDSNKNVIQLSQLDSNRI